VIVLVQEIFTTLISVLAALLTLTSLSGAPLSLPLFLVLISCSSSQAGVAAVASEEAKDNQYLDSLAKSSGDFIPLVCESFGVWTPYALATLFSIADRSTVKNGLSCKVARRQLL